MDLAIFARHSQHVSLSDVTAHGPGLSELRTPKDWAGAALSCGAVYHDV